MRSWVYALLVFGIVLIIPGIWWATRDESAVRAAEVSLWVEQGRAAVMLGPDRVEASTFNDGIARLEAAVAADPKCEGRALLVRALTGRATWRLKTEPFFAADDVIRALELDATLDADALLDDIGHAIDDALAHGVTFDDFRDQDVLASPESVVVKGSVPLGVKRLEIAGAEVSLAGRRFEHRLGLLPDGEHELSLRLVAALNRSFTQSVHFVVDRLPPKMEIDSPRYGDWVQRSVLIQGTVTDSSPCLVTATAPGVESRSIHVGNSGPFSLRLTVDSGPTTITVVVKDSTLREVSRTIDVNVDAEPPRVTMVDADLPVVTAGGTLHVEGTASDETSEISRLEVAGTRVPVTVAGEFSCDVPLDTLVGDTVAVEAWDRAGNMNRVQRDVYVDRTPPSVTIATIDDGDEVSTGLLLAAGSVDDDHFQSLSIADIDIPVIEGAFHYAIPIATVGLQEITIRAEDAVGNVFTDSIEVLAFLACDECVGDGACKECEGDGLSGCIACGGDGVGTAPCEFCHGKGRLPCETCHGARTVARECAKCDSTGLLLCSKCEGVPTKSGKCKKCNGSGRLRNISAQPALPGEFKNTQPCPPCNGQGYGSWTCDRCDGSGRKLKCFKCDGDATKPCPACKGSGLHDDCPDCLDGTHPQRCTTCGGTPLQSTCTRCQGDGSCRRCHGEGFVRDS